MEGNIEIFKGFFIGWRKYSYILSENILTYYNKKNKFKKIHLKISTLKDKDSNSKVFKIYTGINRFKLRFKTKEEKKKLFEAIQISKNKYLCEENDRRCINNIVNSSIEEYDACKDDINSLLDKTNLNKIKGNLNNYWNLILEYNDKISQLLSKIFENKEIKDLSNSLITVNNNIKNNLSTNINLIEEEKEKLKVLFNYISQIDDIKSLKDNMTKVKKSSFNEPVRKNKKSEEINLNEFHSVINNNISEFYSNFDKSLKLISSIQNNQKNKSFNLVNKKLNIHEDINTIIDNSEVFKTYPISSENVRDKLEILVPENQKFSIFDILKNSIGKDLSRMAIPVFMNEPLSFLQRQAEMFEYTEEILSKYSKADNEELAMTYLLGFSYISYAHTLNRTKKPFNPLLGETFNFEIKSINLKVIFEQVSHHPPICAYYAENNDFIIEGHTHMYSKLSFGGFDVTPKGPLFITDKKKNYKYEIKRAKTHLHNYLFGKMYVWHSGKMEIKNLTLNKTIELNFQSHSMSKDKLKYSVNGIIYDDKKNTLYCLDGRWNSYLDAIDNKTNNKIEIVKKHDLIENCERQYYLTKFSLNLNHISYDKLENISPNDSRLRPDQKALEYQNYDLADKFKIILEESQRKRKKERDIRNETYNPKFFKLENGNYIYLKNFYDHLEKKDWDLLEKIYL